MVLPATLPLAAPRWLMHQICAAQKLVGPLATPQFLEVQGAATPAAPPRAVREASG
eukprot:CAMPEP_0198573920 /NCGR_PEP_ID=MMETSP1462-20131121/113917_1 /TAXON_ID=1333877 /ORGANISM="Brandtodinium nutriculum, Strain RCC3387" /LENGTH=55 /DNA_ID=CAMNT_0044305113 /DNA_START=327 /DNA_END=492 /DNA_ORIENTATION=-